jgi:hypothetical protein
MVQSPLHLDTHIVAIDKAEAITLCGIGATDQGANTSMCEAYEADNSELLWRYILGVEIDGIVGVAMEPGRLYVITGDGNLTALGVSNATASTPIISP